MRSFSFLPPAGAIVARPVRSRIAAGLLALLPGLAQAQAPTITATAPTANAVAASRSGSVTVTFDRALNAGSAAALKVFSSQRGGLRTVATPATVSGSALTFAPSAYDFQPGETVQATVTTAAQSSAGTPLATARVFQFTAATTAGAGTFGAKTDFATGAYPYGVALGDVNGDGKLDMVTANNGSSGASVLLGTGTGSFGAKTDYGTGIAPIFVALGDVNGDGKLDMVVANNSPGAAGASVLLGTGTGSFGTKTDYATGANPTFVALGDLNGDGKLDMVVANNSSPGAAGASVFLGTGTGTFGAKTDFATGAYPYSVALGDVNGDGKLDMVTANSGSGMGAAGASVLLGTGTGSFGTNTDFATGANPYGVALGDVSGDGKLDMVVANVASSSASVLLGTGTGTFGAKTDYNTGSNPHALALGDVNGDGILDMVTANYDGGAAAGASVLLGTGTGTFGARTDYATGASAVFVALGDVSGDGRLDIVAANYGGSGALGASVLLAPSPVPAITSIAPTTGVAGTTGIVLTGTGLSGATAVSVNGAAATITANTATTVTITLPAGASNTQSITVTTAGGTSAAYTSFVVKLNPIVTGTSPAANAVTAPLANSALAVGFTEPVTSASAANIKVFSAQAGGLKAGTVAVSGSTATYTSSLGAALKDFRPGETVNVTVPATVLGAGGLAATPYVYQFTAAAAAASGTFGAKTDYTTRSRPASVALGDVNGDGILDMVVANNGSIAAVGASVLLGTGTGTFGAKTDYATGDSPIFVALGDVNGDGKLDMVVANVASSSASVLLGTGTGTFGAKTDYNTGLNLYALALGDVNGDGKLDMVTANFSANNASVLLGTGTGSFGAKTDFATGTSPRSVALGDVNGDGKLDMVTANNGSTGAAGASVLLGTGTGAFGAKTDYATGATPNGVALGDVNGDGKLDMVVANIGSTVAVGASVLLGTGTGTFGAKTEYATGDSPYGVALGDVNGDGKLDMVTANFSANNASVLLGTGTGTFGAKADYATGASPFALALGDVNGDGRLDVATVNNGSNGPAGASVLLGLPSVPAIAATGLNPTSGPVGTSVTITGTNLGGATSVSFNGGAQTTITSNTATSLTVVVPASATTGLVTVTTAQGTSAASAQTFTVTPSLSNLVLSAGTLSPTFASGTTSYTLTVPGTTTATTVTPTNAQSSGGTITVNGTTVSSGSASGSIALTPGTNAITVVVNAPSGGATQTYTVTVTRICNVTAMAQNVSVALDASGNATVAAAAVNNGSNSTCGSVTLSVSPSSFTCANVGTPVPVMLTVTDSFGGSATAAATVTVTDATAPTALAQAVAVSVAANGRVYVAPSAVNNGSSDNCALTNVALSASSFGSCTASAALAFDGTDDYVSLPSGLTSSATSFTFEAWVNYQDNGVWTRIFDFGTGTNTWMILGPRSGYGSNNGYIFFGIVANRAAGPEENILTTTAMPTGWHHLAVTMAPNGNGTNTGIIYLDGVVIGTNPGLSVTPAALGTLNQNFLGRSQYPDPYLKGQLDEIRIWNTTRTAAEISLYKDKSLGGTTAGLLAYYDFNDGPGSSTVTNRGSVGGTAALNNFTTATAFVGPGQVPALGTGAQIVTLTVSDKAGNVSSTTTTVTVSVPALTSVTWTGNASTDWTDCRNWSYGTLPTAAISAVLPAGMPRYPSLPAGTYPTMDLTLASGSSLTTASTATLQVSGSFANNGGTATLAGPVVFTGSATSQTVGGSASTSFATIEVNKASGSVSLGRDLSISSALALTSGTLSTGSYKVALGNTATLSETETSYVSGAMETTRVLNTAGTGSSFGGLGVTLTPAASSSALPGSTLVRRVTGTPATGVNSSSGIGRYFVITPTVDANLNVTLVFAYADHELNGIAESRLKLFKSESSAAGPWARVDYATYNATANTVTRTNIASLSTWTLGNADAPLPVELRTFTAEAAGADALLSWTTASEKNADRFEAEASADGREFHRVGTVAGAGSSAALKAYSFRDLGLNRYASPQVYYRLRQVDLDGTATYSPVRLVQVGHDKLMLTLYPNPARTAVTVGGVKAGASVEVLDALGRTVAQATAEADGTAHLTLPAELAAGVYLVRSGRQSQRLALE